MWAAKYCEDNFEVKGDAANFGDAFDKIVGEELGFPVTEAREGKDKVKYADGEWRRKNSTPEVEHAVKHYLDQKWAWKSARATQVFCQLTPERWSELSEIYGGYPEIPDRLIGFIDLLRPTPESEGLSEQLRPIEIADLKTIASDSWKEEWARQCVLYSLATGAQRWSIHRFVRHKPELLACKTVEMNTPEAQFLVKEVMDHTAYYAWKIWEVRENKIGISHLPRSPGFHCKYCPLKNECKSGKPFDYGVLPGRIQWAK